MPNRLARSSVLPSIKSTFEQLESRRLLASAAAAVDLPGVATDIRTDHEFRVTFQPQSSMLLEHGGFLTGRQGGRRADIARDTLADFAAQMGLTAADTRFSQIHQQNTSEHNGVTHVYFQQMLNGLSIRGATATVNIMSDGRILNVGGSFLPGMEQAQRDNAAPNLTGMIHPTWALRTAAETFGLEFDGTVNSLDFNGGAQFSFRANDAQLSMREIPIRAEYVPTEDGLRLAWNFNLEFADGSDWYEISVDAKTNQIIWANSYYESLDAEDEHDHAGNGGTNVAQGGTTASYNVFPHPMESPYDGPRQIVVNPHELSGVDPLTGASPFGWHDTDGDIDPDFTDTRGNNVEARDDANNNNGTDGLAPDGGAGLDFDFPMDLTVQGPAEYRAAAVTNLYYWNNFLHDMHYTYGFTEKWWNFQVNNYGREGTTFPNQGAGDPVQADAQDGGGTNNANFGTPADGSDPRMQMYLWPTPNPDRDGDLDNGIITHEYGHGVSNRINTRGAGQMASNQSRGMGEGWGDWWGLMFSFQPGDTATTLRGIGNYALNEHPTTGDGIRTFPYSTDTNLNPMTWGLYGSGSYTSPYRPQGPAITRQTAVHFAGTIWATTLWDMQWNLVAKHGHDTNLYTGYDVNGTAAERAGNKLALQLVMDALKLHTATNPTFTQSRDAILQADVALTGGANQKEIWQAFAKRGLGFNAIVQTNAASTTTLVDDFSMPPQFIDPYVIMSTPSGTNLGAVSNVVFSFAEPIDPASFSVADDVASFTGPGGTDLRSLITSSNVNGRILTLTLSPVAAAVGNYSMTIGPNILSADNGRAMDQDQDGTVGEPTEDQFTRTFSVTRTVGPEAFGYVAAEHAFQPGLDLVIGAPGVNTLINAVASNFATLTLPAGNTFNFYGTNFTQMFPNTEGLITFVSGSTSSTNSDLTTTPTQAAIAAFWDTFTTSANGTGAATDSAVLWTIQGNNLIIEWSDLAATTTSNGAVTVQAVLELNTGAAPGRIRLNYPDVTVLNSTAAVGIKDAGTQTVVNRRLSLQNVTTVGAAGNPWVATGKSLIFDIDVVAPEVTSSVFSFETATRASFGITEDVGATFVNDNVELFNRTTNAVVDRNYTTEYDGFTNTGALALSSALIADGDYRVTLKSDPFGSAIFDAAGNALDGNKDGIGGGAHVFEFFFVRGDANRDRSVNITDFSILSSNFNDEGTFSEGDSNYDGDVDIADFSILASKFNFTLEQPARSSNAAGSNTADQPTRTLASAPAKTNPFATKEIADDRVIDEVLM